MSQHDSSLILLTSILPDISNLFASYSEAPSFCIKERNVPTAKNEEEATCHPLSSFPLHVDIARELRSAQYSRNKAKNSVRFARVQESKRQDRPRRGHSAQRSKGGKRSGKRQPVPQDLTMDLETDFEQDLSVFQEPREAVLAPVRMYEDRPISTSISPELWSSTRGSAKVFTPLDLHITTTLPESTFNIPTSDTAREFRSYERHRHQAKKSASFRRSREKKGTRVKPIPTRSSKSTKAENIQSLVSLTMVDEGAFSEDEIQTLVEAPLSPDLEYAGAPAPVAVDMEALITTAKVRYTKEPDFEFVKSVLPVVALDDFPEDGEEEHWEHLWNDDLLD